VSVETPAVAATRARVSGYSIYVLAVLLVVYTFNFIDRIVLGVLVPPIKLELGLTDTQLGLLGGTAFALFYTALGIPIGWLADRVNRVWIMTAALGLWSLFTAACGLVTSFTQLFFARLGVGVGEAGGVAPAYSLLADYFPPEQRARALSVYSFGIPIGSALGAASISTAVCDCNRTHGRGFSPDCMIAWIVPSGPTGLRLFSHTYGISLKFGGARL